MNDTLLSDSETAAARMEAWRQITPMGRWGTPDDVASAVLFLLGPGADYITGEVINVNGGALTLAPGQLDNER